MDGFVFKGQLGLIAHVEETSIPVYTWLPGAGAGAGAGSVPPSRQGLASGSGLASGQQSPQVHQSPYPSPGPGSHSYPSPGLGPSPGPSPDTRRNLFHEDGDAAIAAFDVAAAVGSTLQQLQMHPPSGAFAPPTTTAAPILFGPLAGFSPGPSPGPGLGLSQPSLTSSAQSIVVFTGSAKPVRDTLSLSYATPPATLLRISTIKVELYRDPTRPFRRCASCPPPVICPYVPSN